MHAPAIRNNPFLIFLMFIVAGYMLTRWIGMSDRTSVFCIFVFALAGAVAAISELQDKHFLRWTRKLDTVLTMERPAVSAVVAASQGEDLFLRNVTSKVWYGHAMAIANGFTIFRRDETTCTVIAYLGDEPVGMFSSDGDNWLVLGQGELVS